MFRVGIYRGFLIVLVIASLYSDYSGNPVQVKSAEAAVAPVTIILKLASSSPWTVPADWNNSSNSIQVIGAGGGGRSSGAAAGGGGGGGGGFASSTNLTLSGTVAFSVGDGGNAGVNGTDTYICNSTSNCASITGSAVIVAAKGGMGATSTNPAMGGTTTQAVGTTKFNGGRGGLGVSGALLTSGGGGGAAGVKGDGRQGGDGDPASGGDDGGGGGGGAGGGLSTAGVVGGTSGGNGGIGPTNTAGGAGGAASVGSPGSNGSGGGGGDNGQSGGNGGTGTEWTDVGSGGGGGGAGNVGVAAVQTGGNGGLFGGGGGGGETGGAGGDGLIVITYVPVVPVSFSGTLYSDEGVNALTGTKNIKIVVGTSTPSIHSTTTLTSGAWNYTFSSVSSEFGASTPILVYVDGDTTTRGALFTKVADSTSAVSGLNLYQNRVIIRHEGTSGTSTRLTDLSFYDNDNDTDIQFNASPSALTVNSNNELYIWPEKIFNATGTVTVNGNASSTSQIDGSFHIGTGGSFETTGTTTLAGSFIASSSALYVSTSTLLFNATTTGKSIYATSTALGATTFNGVGGGWNFVAAATTSNLTITNGTVVAPSTNLTISGNYSNAGTFTHNSGTTTFNGTSAQTISGFATGTNALASVVFKGAGTKVFPATASTTNFVIESGSGAVTAPSSRLSITGNYINSGTFTHNSGTTTFSGASSQIATGTLSGASAFATLVIANTGTTTFGASLTASQRFYASSSASTALVFGSSATVTLTSATIIGNPTNQLRLRSTTPGTRWTLDLDGTYEIANVDVQDSNACPTSGSLITTSNVINSGNNSCWIAVPLTLSGGLYSNEGIISLSSPKTIGIAIGTSTPSQHATTSLVSGVWNFTLNDNSYVSASTPILVWVDGDTTTRAAVFTKATSTSNISGLNLYEDHVIIRHEGASGTSTTLSDLSFYDNDNDADIQFNASLSALTVSAHNKLYIWPGKIFNATGTVTVNANASSTSSVDGSLHIGVGAQYGSVGTTTVGGSFTASSSALYTSTSSLLFNATTTGKTILATSTSIGTTTFNSVSGSWAFINSATTSNLTIVNGTLVAPSTNLTITGDYLNAGTFTHNSGTTTFSGASAQTATGTMTGTSSFNHLSFFERGEKIIGDNASSSNFYIAANATVTTNSRISISGNYTNDGIFRGGGLWVARTAAEANAWRAVTYGNDRFVAVASAGTNRVMTSQDGITWNASMASEANSWYSVTYGNGLFVALSIDGTNQVMTSPDGNTWTPALAAAANSWNSVTYGNGLFVAVSATTSTSTAVMTSPDGITWTARSAAAANGWKSVTYGNGLFVATSNSGINRVMTSPDGITWTARSAASVDEWNSVTYGNGLFVAVSSQRVMTSPDGITWSLQSIPLRGSNTDITYTNGVFVVVGFGIGSRMKTSPDGITWSLLTMPEENLWTSVAAGRGIVAAVAATGVNRVMTTFDSVTTFSSESPQNIAGNLTGTSTFRDVAFLGAGTKTFLNNASTTNFDIQSGSGAVTAPSGALTIYGNYTNAGTFTHNSGTTTFSGASAQTAAGTMTGTSAFNNTVFSSAGAKTLLANASTTNFIIESGSGAVIAPTLLSIGGNYSNAGTFTHNSGTTTFNGVGAQNATGTLSGASAFATLVIANTGTTTFGATLTASQRFYVSSSAGASLVFAANGTTTLNNAILMGALGNELRLRSTSAGTQGLLDLDGSYTIAYVDVKDSNACPTSGSLITTSNVINSGNNNCWIAVPLTLSGILYSDEGVTPLNSSKTIGIAIGTSTQSRHATTSLASGAWSFIVNDNTYFATSTPVLVWVDGDINTRATVFTKAADSTSAISGLDLYQNRVIIRHEGTSGTSTRLTDLAFYDNDEDSDIQYNASPSALTVNANNELYIWPGKIFNATGTVTVNGNASSNDVDGSLHIAAGAQYGSVGTTTLAGSFIASSSALYTSTSSILFNATTTGKTVFAPVTTLGNTQFNGAGGGWTFATSATTSNLTVTAGTLTAPTGNLSISGNYENSGTFTHNGGTVTFASTTATTTYTNFSFDTAASGNANSYGLTYSQGFFWSTDYTDDEVYKYTSSGIYTGTSFDTAASGNTDAASIVSVADFFYIVDETGAEIYKYTLDGTYTGTSFDTAASGNGDPIGITYVNSFFWVTDGVDNEVYKYTLDGTYTGTSFDTAASGIGDAYGITYANGFFWVSDYSTGVYKYTLDGTYTGTSFDTATNGNGAVVGSTYANGFLWVTDVQDSAVYKYTLGQVASGTMTGTSAFNNVTFSGAAPKGFGGNASTSNFTVETSSGGVEAPTSGHLSISGNYSNSTTTGFGHGNGTTTFNGTSAQTIAGIATGTSAFAHTVFTGAGAKALPSEASTTNFVIESGSGVVTAPSSKLSIGGNYRNSSTFTHNSGTTTFNGESAQTAAGTMTGSSALNNVAFTGVGTKALSANASTTNFIIESSSGAVIAPALLSIAGNYSNSSTFTAGTGTTTLNGTSPQTLTGGMIGANAFRNLAITNTSGAGSSSQSVFFNGAASTTGTLTMKASTSAKFLANASTTFESINLEGAAGQYVWLRSSVPGSRYSFYVSGTVKGLAYVQVQDSSACPGTIDATGGSNVDAGNNVCWTFPSVGSVTISSAANQIFSYNQATTSMSTITVTEGGSSITALNDLRIVIATGTANMRFDTTDTTASFGGTASSKVSNPVSYEQNGTVLVIPVSSNFSTGETLTIAELSYTQFSAVSPAVSALGVRTEGIGTSTSFSDDKTIGIGGTLTLNNHSASQVSDNFDTVTEVDETLFGFSLASTGENAQVTSITVSLTGAHNISTADLTNVRLMRDINGDQEYDGGDIAVGGAGAVSITKRSGTIVFSTAFNISSVEDYIVVGDIARVNSGDSLTLSLTPSNIVSTGLTSALSLSASGNVEYITHRRGGQSQGGGSGEVDGDAPGGDGDQGGGDEDGGGEVGGDTGESIGSEPGFNTPGSHGSPFGAWTSGGNAYVSDGVYMSTSGASAQHSFGSFGFNVPSGNTINGIVVKLEAKGSTAAGTVGVRLSWDGGSSVTSLDTTDTLTTSDAVYTLGSPSDLWGRTWSFTEFADGSLLIELIANTSSNTLSVDAIQARVYHQASGGGGGGGGGGEI